MRLLSCTLIFLPAVCLATHFVLLKTNQTIENFMTYDLSHPISEQIQGSIADTYEIGDLSIISGSFTDKGLKRLLKCPLVAEVAPEIKFQAYSIYEQTNAPKHLVSLSHKSGPIGDTESYYFSEDATGDDVIVYIIDGGIGRKGSEFSDRIVVGVDFTKDELGAADYHGHGTHVSGIVASLTFGVAKDANLVVLKVLDSKGQGSLELVVSALEFAVNHHRQSGLPGVVNLSLGAPYSALINRIVDAVSRTGLVVVVAAGNDGNNACFYLPAGARSVITVGAINDQTNRIAEFSNWGPCVDIFASGVNVASVSASKLKLQQKHKLRRAGLHVYLGTSMAAPIVSGLVATFLSQGISDNSVKDHLLLLAVDNMIPEDEFAARPNTPNRIAYNGCDPEEESDNDEA